VNLVDVDLVDVDVVEADGVDADVVDVHVLEADVVDVDVVDVDLVVRNRPSPSALTSSLLMSGFFEPMLHKVSRFRPGLKQCPSQGHILYTGRPDASHESTEVDLQARMARARQDGTKTQSGSGQRPGAHLRAARCDQ
jgi:hypothetical protein